MPERVRAADLTEYVQAVLSAQRVDAAQSRAVARILIWSELVGRPNFGLMRLPILLKRVAAGVLNRACRPRFDELGPGAALLHGDAGFGHYVGDMAMARAIDLAQRAGIGAVGVHDSNFYGAGAYFVDQAAQAGMLGLALSNSFPKVAAHGGVLPVLGTNPFAFGAPRRGGRSLLFDMATSGLAGSTVREHIDRNQPLPEGLAVDARGAPILDPRKVEEGALLPFGGAKGFGLALMVEILAGVITGAGMSSGVASMYKDFQARGDNGHFMLAIDIARWMPLEAYYDRFEGLIALVRASDPDGCVKLPGEVRWKYHDDNTVNGIAVPDDVAAQLMRLSDPHRIRFPQAVA